MDVFLHNVPVHMDEQSLVKELTPFMNALGIADDWACQKVKLRAYALVHFLNAKDAQKFLQQHGTVLKMASPKPSTANSSTPALNKPPKLISESRLYILGKHVQAQPSKNPIQSTVLNHLRYEKTAKEKKRKRDPKAQSLTFDINRIACGKMIFLQDEQLTFANETDWNNTGNAKFGPQSLVVTLFSFTDSKVRLDFGNSTVVGLMVNSQKKTMTLILSEPPKMYKEISPLLQDGRKQGPKWARVPAIDIWSQHSSCAKHCLVYQLSVMDNANIMGLTRQIYDREWLPVEYASLRSIDAVEDNYRFSLNSLQNTLENASKRNALPFVILFQIERLVWDNYLHPATALRLFYAMEAHVAECRKNKTDTFLTTDSMKKCLANIPYPITGTTPDDLSSADLLATFIATEQDAVARETMRFKDYGADIPPNQIWVLRATVTPSRITLTGPDPETGNKVLRRFQDRSTFFMRVTFADEDGQSLSYNPKITNEPIYERYQSILQKGIKVAGRVYQFLGFSHSSLRSHSTWFMAAFVDENHERHDRESILRTLGEFNQIRIPAKCAARIGQAFSETPYPINIMKEGIRVSYMDDVKSDDHVFSDGVGTLSKEMAMIIWAAYPSLKAATCFQIRWAGFKGMLSLDTRLRGKQMVMRRESMMKFRSEDYEELGICDAATRPLRLVLNRQMIKILEDMGTDLGWFERLQKKAIQMLKDVTAEATNAGTFLEYQLVGTSIGLPQFIRHLARLRIDYLQDTFLKTVVEHVVLRELRLLKHKARIPVDNGVTLFGVMDETAYLEENEVYFSFERTNGRRQLDYTLPENGATVLVTRSPALHPGDIQLARLIIPPEGHPLLELKNCIVFSQKGSRDLPSQLSGGDLDGDIYNVIWDTGAMPTEIFFPGAYPRPNPPELDRAVTRDDIAEFFINFMRTDILGVIATRHQTMADVRDDGTLDPDCIKLAELHSTAVDYSKTGVPVAISKLPKAPRSKPDFLAPAPPVKLYDLGQIAHIADDESDDDDDETMSRTKQRYHESQKILGKLYRAIDERKIWENDIRREVKNTSPSVWEQLFGLAVRKLEDLGVDHTFSHLFDEAKKIQTNYEAGIESLRWQFSENGRTPLSEVETFCGSILNKNGAQTNRQRDSSIKLKEETDRVMSDTMDLIRRLDNPRDKLEESLRGPHAARLSLACLAANLGRTGGNQQQSRTSNRNAKSTNETEEGSGLVSFRVVAGCCIIKELNIMDGTRNMGGGYVGVSGPNEIRGKDYASRTRADDELTKALGKLQVKSF